MDLKLRVTCKECGTSYTADRCGLSPKVDETSRAIIKCGTCGCTLHVTFEPVAATRSMLDTLFGRHIPSTHRVTVR